MSDHPTGLAGTARRHWLMTALLVAGAVLRVVAQVAYRPALLYADSSRYLINQPFDPATINPIGYALLVRPAVWLGELWLIPAVQHLVALALAVLLYALLLRWRAPRWLAALAAAPLLLDAYWLQMEQHIMAETAFMGLVVGALALLTWWHEHPPWWAIGAAGLALGVSAPVRMIGLVLIVPALAYVLVVLPDWRRRGLGALLAVATFALPLLAYAGWYQASAGEFRLSPSWLRPRMLYARTAQVADCGTLGLAEPVRQLCPSPELRERLNVDEFNWSGDSPLRNYVPGDGIGVHEAASRFGWTVVREQPLDVAGVVVKDVLRGFLWEKRDVAEATPVERWRFPPEEFRPYAPPHATTLARAGSDYEEPVVVEPLARLLRGYQLSVGFTPGPVLALALLGSLAGGAVALRQRRRTLGGAALLWGLSGLALVAVPATYQFSWRYWLPVLLVWPPAGVLGVRALLDRFGTGYAPGRVAAGPPAATRSGRDPQTDPVDAAAVADFRDRHGRPRLAPLVVVIAAYQEEDGIGAVLDAMPGEVGGLATDTLVVVDGATDDTARVAAEHGALVCEAPVNRGQGAALRLGYHLAREGGADYIATLDADGQYDPAELELIVEPLLLGTADFVTGSRRLGREETTDRFRRAGVRVFAWLASLLSGQRITDTSNGLRAMRAEVTAAVRLTQPQYQASELLMGALARGFRVTERATTMRQRAAGESHKGNDLLYGLRYARVLVGTWLRERLRSPNSQRS